MHKKTTSQLRPFLVELPIRIKTYDIDSAKHVNNIVYVRWLEDLRLHFLDTHLTLETLHEQGITPIIVETNIHYRQPIRLGDKMVTDINNPGASSLAQSELPIFYDYSQMEGYDNFQSTFNHTPGGSNVLYMDGHVEWQRYPAADGPLHPGAIGHIG